MANEKVIPLIMSGGAGTRLWPLSRNSQPKQFLSFGGENSLFQETILRTRNELFDPRPIVMGAKDHRFLIAEDYRNLGIEGDILLEPVPRNSCAAIAAGCFQALARQTDPIVVVLAADHHIPDTKAFQSAVANALPLAKSGQLVTFGVTPTAPKTGYGYILPGDAILGGGSKKVLSFVEKPDEETAKTYLSEGYLWNSGNFLFKASIFLSELDKYNSEIFHAVKTAFAGIQSDLDFLLLDEVCFTNSPSISVDYAVMEKTDKAAVFPVSYEWSDVGTWSSIWQLIDKDESGNAVIGDAVVFNGFNNLIHSQDSLVALSGVDDLTVVVTKDAILICRKEQSEDVKKVVSFLKTNSRSEAVDGLKMFRPWGNYEQLDIGEKYQVKRIVVAPGGVLSLQKHEHRAEHWVVVSGVAEVTVNESVFTLHPNHSIEIPQGAIHRLANRTNESVVLIEVQSGTYFGEDDIIRLDDIYNRTDK